MEVLRQQAVEFTEFRDIRQQLLNETEVRELAQLAGGLDKLFSTRATLYRELQLGKQKLSAPDMLRWMTTEWTLVRRPLFVTSDRRIFIGGNLQQVATFARSLRP